jgi:hypothetical protein
VRRAWNKALNEDRARAGSATGSGALRSLAIAGASMLVGLGVVLPGAVGASAAAPTWVMRGIPALGNYPLKSVACSGTECVALASKCSVGGCGGLLPAKAFVSTNVGASWKAAAVPGSVGDASSVSCGSPDLCIATATKGPPGPHSSSAIIVSRTGGKSWAVDDEAVYSLSRATACATATSCVALGSMKSSSSTLISLGLVTTNAGKSWSKAGFPAKKAYINAVACGTSTSCVAVGENSEYTAGIAFFSTNVGKSWKQMPLPVGATSVQTVSCNGLDCAAITITQALVSRNGGKSWTMRRLPVVYGRYFQSAACLSGTRCVLVGYQTASTHSSPVAEITGNGGSSWSTQAVPKVDGSLSGVACERGTCVAVGVREVYTGTTPKAEYPLALTY